MDGVIFCVFFKQKTAYEMRISDWSSDVCSSDLIVARQDRMDEGVGLEADRREMGAFARAAAFQPFVIALFVDEVDGAGILSLVGLDQEIGRASCREGVCQYV